MFKFFRITKFIVVSIGSTILLTGCFADGPSGTELKNSISNEIKMSFSNTERYGSVKLLGYKKENGYNEENRDFYTVTYHINITFSHDLGQPEKGSIFLLGSDECRIKNGGDCIIIPAGTVFTAQGETTFRNTEAGWVPVNSRLHDFVPAL